MNDALNSMLKRYNCNSIDDYENALKEIVQEISLLGLLDFSNNLTASSMAGAISLVE